MNRIFAVILISLTFAFSAASAHESHTNHNMILLGSDEIFATHIVYNVPHNFQVILTLQLPLEVKTLYQQQRQLHPNDQFRFVLKHLDISQIQALGSVTGAVLRVHSDGKKTTIIDDVTLTKNQFKVLFFDELPLSLAADGL